MHDIVYEKRVYKDLSKIPNKNLDKIKKVIDSLKIQPRPVGCKKLIGQANRYRVKIGRFRVLYLIDDKEKTVRIGFIGHRKEVYRRF